MARRKAVPADDVLVAAGELGARQIAEATERAQRFVNAPVEMAQARLADAVDFAALRARLAVMEHQCRGEFEHYRRINYEGIAALYGPGLYERVNGIEAAMAELESIWSGGNLTAWEAQCA